jgi:hypothetical protein
MYLSGVRRPDLPFMLTPRQRQRPFAGQSWAADNGRFSAPHNYTDEDYLVWLWVLAAYRDDCLFATAPDVVGDADATLALSLPMLPRIRELGYRAAFVGQDGATVEQLPWDAFDALFLGGTTAWKLGPAAAALAAEAKRRGKWVHMGRVNSLRRMVYAESIGCDSADGTWLKHRPPGDHETVSGWVRHVIANPSLWRE